MPQFIPEQQEQAAAARDMIKAVYEDGEAEINGRRYTFHKMTHKQRRKVFAFFTSIGAAASTGDLSFLDSAAFEPVEKVIMSTVSIDGSLLDKLGDRYWEQHPDDYIPFIQTALGAISYPFTVAAPTS